eukprot:TRINITY_DN1625_c0_g1_i5.p1 TRINITY_DN1625_c0_g1~~TRINITY_DN1625_c0_g1_i5.p1  ORF type:complete len:232 (+),score=36.00 TRINITY_DN1625_c0_g1_i5:57-698(+)
MSQVNLNESHKIETKQLDMPSYLLCGPGPSNPHPRVMQAMSFHASSHFFQSFWDLLVETQELLRYVFQTDNEMTFAVSGTGSAAMECGVSSIIEKGDTVVVCSRGYWGVRMVELCERIGANVVELDGEYGVAFTYDELEMAVLEHKPKMLLMTHGEVSPADLLQPQLPALSHPPKNPFHLPFFFRLVKNVSFSFGIATHFSRVVFPFGGIGRD